MFFLFFSGYLIGYAWILMKSMISLDLDFAISSFVDEVTNHSFMSNSKIEHVNGEDPVWIYNIKTTLAREQPEMPMFILQIETWSWKTIQKILKIK